MKAECCSKIVVSIYKTRKKHNPDHKLNTHTKKTSNLLPIEEEVFPPFIEILLNTLLFVIVTTQILQFSTQVW